MFFLGSSEMKEKEKSPYENAMLDNVKEISEQYQELFGASWENPNKRICSGGEKICKKKFVSASMQIDCLACEDARAHRNNKKAGYRYLN